LEKLNLEEKEMKNLKPVIKLIDSLLFVLIVITNVGAIKENTIIIIKKLKKIMTINSNILELASICLLMKLNTGIIILKTKLKIKINLYFIYLKILKINSLKQSSHFTNTFTR